ncbi:hypothetical protein N0V85_007211, partial [Neurospora sp. IMI 360204]
EYRAPPPISLLLQLPTAALMVFPHLTDQFAKLRERIAKAQDLLEEADAKVIDGVAEQPVDL